MDRFQLRFLAMILTVYTLNVLLRKMMHFICIFVIPFISDSYFILR